MKNKLMVDFYEDTTGRPLKFVVLSAWHNGKWIFVQHKDRETFEIPGGHIEKNETSLDAARRELFEETGAIEFELFPICIYGVSRDNDTTYGELYFASIAKLSELPPEYEMRKRVFSETLPEELTYPLIQPFLFERTKEWLQANEDRFF